MKALRLLFCGSVLALVSGPGPAQDLAIINARVIDGTGRVYERATLDIRAGRIEAVRAGAEAAARGPVLDAGGMTVLPGYIDAHRHIITGDPERWFGDEAEIRLREFLAAGFTTLLSGGGPVPGILELKQRIESGALEGPRIITSGRVDPSDFPTPEAAIAEVGRLAELGIEIIKARIEPEDEALLRVIVEAARARGLEVMVHAVTVPAMRAAVATGAGKLVHTPHGSFMSAEDAVRVAEAGIENLSTVGFAVPVFGVFNDDNLPTFRDGSPWPAGILGTGSNAAGEKIVNARTLWDAGVTYGFGTDTSYDPRDGLYHELKGLNVMFSPRDIIRLMGPNTAAFIDRSDELGTVEAGKLADLVLLDGDPLHRVFDLLEVAVVIKGGRIVVDRR